MFEIKACRLMLSSKSEEVNRRLKWRKGERHSLYYPADTAGFLKLMGIFLHFVDLHHVMMLGK